MMTLDAFKVYLEVIKLMPTNHLWEETFSINLTDKEKQNQIQLATGLSWWRIRNNLEYLSQNHIIDLQTGNGRGKKTKITLVSPPVEVLGESFDTFQNLLSENQKEFIERTIKDVSVSQLPLLRPSWLKKSVDIKKSQFIAAPPADRYHPGDIFIGRGEFIRHFSEILKKNHLVVMVGHPGVGKTHLLSWYQQQLVTQLEYGVQIFWIKLNAGDTLSSLSEEFLLRARGERSTNIATEYTMTANKNDGSINAAYALFTELRQGRYFLLIDNFEKILDESLLPKDEGYQEFLKLLMEHECGESRVVILSHWIPKDERGRSPVAIELGGMDEDDGTTYLRELGLKITRADASIIVRKLDGNPLALQLLRRQWETAESNLDPEQIDYSTVLRAVQDAFESLSEDEKIILGAISVLDQNAFEPIVRILLNNEITSEKFEELIENLIYSKRLISSSNISKSTNSRVFRIHQLIQTYTLEKAIPSERINKFYLDAMNYWIAQADPSELLTKEWELALNFSIYAESYKTTVEILFDDQVFSAFLSAGRYSQLNNLLESIVKESTLILDETRITVVRRAQTRNIEKYLDRIYRSLGIVSWRLGKLDNAERYYKRLFALDQIKLENDFDYSYSLQDNIALAGVYLDKAATREGITLAESILDKAIKSSDKFTEMEALNLLGYAYDDIGPFEKAEAAYKKAISISEELNKKVEICIGEVRLGMLYWKVEQFENAGPHFKKALLLATELNDPYYLGMAQGDMGHYYLDKPNRSNSELDKAIFFYLAAKETHESVGVMRGLGYWIGQLGRAYFYKGSSKKGIQLLKQAISIHRDVGDRSAMPRHCHYLALINSQQKSIKQQLIGWGYFIASIELFRKLEAQLEEPKVQVNFDRFLSKIDSESLIAFQKIALANSKIIIDFIERKPNGNLL